MALGETPDCPSHAIGRTYVHPLLHLKVRWEERRGFAGRVQALGQAISNASDPGVAKLQPDLLELAPRLGRILLVEE